jgi:hypothetical protein
MKVFLAYIAPIILLLFFLAGILAQIAVDAHHWLPRNWWPSFLRKK